jgi:hypothetical protein
MRRRTLGTAAILGTTLVAAMGLGVAVASAATSAPGRGAAPADSAASTSRTGSADPGSSAATPSPSASSTSSPSDGKECADVFLVTAPTGDAVGTLCTAVTASGIKLGGVTVTFTASGCTGNVTLRVSGVDQKGEEFGEVKKVICTSGAATASFAPVTEVPADNDVCGTLLSTRYTAAEACVPITS